MSALVTPVLGVDVDVTLAGTTTDGAGAAVALGSEVIGADGITYRYVQAGAAISTTTDEPYALAIDESNQAVKLTAALGLVGHKFGIAPRLIISDNDFFWARVNGTNVPMRVTAAAAADALLGIGGVGAAGRLASSVTASAGNMVVRGLVITAVASASASAGNTIRNAIMTFPVCTTAVAD